MSKISFKSPRGQWVKSLAPGWNCQNFADIWKWIDFDITHNKVASELSHWWWQQTITWANVEEDLRCGAIIMRSSFSEILTIDTHNLLACERYGVSFCEYKFCFMICLQSPLNPIQLRPVQFYQLNQQVIEQISSFWYLLNFSELSKHGVLFNSLRPSDAIWRHISGSTLAQVMACCLKAPSHYLNQCWLIISKV